MAEQNAKKKKKKKTRDDREEREPPPPLALKQLQTRSMPDGQHRRRGRIE